MEDEIEEEVIVDDFPLAEKPPTTPDTVDFKALTKSQRCALINLVFNEHSYAQDLPPSQEGSPKPFQVLKVKEEAQEEEDEEFIDVEYVETPPQPVVRYDVEKARWHMNEVDVYLNSLWKDVDKDEEEKFTRGTWSREQTALFDAVYKAVTSYQLAKLTYTQHPNEPILRRIALDKATKRMRRAFSSLFWNPKQVGWLHGIVLDGLGSSSFLCYLEILQSVKRKVPELIERTLLSDKAATEKERTAGLPNLSARLRKTWQPSVSLSTNVVMEKFPSNPFLLILPSGPSITHQSSKRTRFWSNQLATFGKPVLISVPTNKPAHAFAVKSYLDHCVSAVRAKINECHRRFPHRKIILIGWDVGSLIMTRVASMDKVDSVVCLGFPCSKITNQQDKEYWKKLQKVECPVLFFVGGHGASNSLKLTEKFADSIKHETKIVAVESGNTMLCLTNSQKRKLGLTQSMLDKIMQDTIYLFLRRVLFPIKSPPIKEDFPPKKKKKLIVEKEKRVKKTVKSPPQLAPLDISVPVVTIPQISSPGLLTTQNLSLLTSTLPGSEYTFKIGQKRPASKEKKHKAPKMAKKHSTAAFTASLGSQKSGNLGGQLFSSSSFEFGASNSGKNNKVQRIPVGSFMLTGNTGKLRLQGSNSNFVYVPQNIVTTCASKQQYATSSFSAAAQMDETESATRNLSAQLMSENAADESFSTPSKSTFCSPVQSKEPSPEPSSIYATIESLSKTSPEIFSQLSTNDIQYLAGLLAKQQATSQPSSPLQSPISTPSRPMSPLSSGIKFLPVTSQQSASLPTSPTHGMKTFDSEKSAFSNKISYSTSIFSQKANKVRTVNVTKANRVKTTQAGKTSTITFTYNIPALAKSSTGKGKNSTKTTFSSPSLTASQMSAYLAQHKFVLRPSSSTRTVTVASTKSTDQKPSSPLASKSAATSPNKVGEKTTKTIMLHLPPQVFNDPKLLKLTAYDQLFKKKQVEPEVSSSSDDLVKPRENPPLSELFTPALLQPELLSPNSSAENLFTEINEQPSTSNAEQPTSSPIQKITATEAFQAVPKIKFEPTKINGGHSKLKEILSCIPKPSTANQAKAQHQNTKTKTSIVIRDLHNENKRQVASTILTNKSESATKKDVLSPLTTIKSFSTTTVVKKTIEPLIKSVTTKGVNEPLLSNIASKTLVSTSFAPQLSSKMPARKHKTIKVFKTRSITEREKISRPNEPVATSTSKVVSPNFQKLLAAVDIVNKKTLTNGTDDDIDFVCSIVSSEKSGTPAAVETTKA